jgi:hypothetical protein
MFDIILTTSKSENIIIVPDINSEKIMKRFIILFVLLAAVLLTSCEESDPVVGNSGVTVINNLAFVVDTTFVDSSGPRMVARGSVTNNGSTTVNSPWFIEAQFYTSNTSNTKLGGNNTRIGVPLSRGQSTYWTIYFTSNNVDVRNYPNFGVKDIRGFYDK